MQYCYAYVGDDPIDRTDSSGKEAVRRVMFHHWRNKHFRQMGGGIVLEGEVMIALDAIIESDRLQLRLGISNHGVSQPYGGDSWNGVLKKIPKMAQEVVGNHRISAEVVSAKLSDCIEKRNDFRCLLAEVLVPVAGIEKARKPQ